MGDRIGSSRDTLLVMAKELIGRFGQSRDPQPLLDEDADELILALSSVSDPEAAYVLGTLHWLRHLLSQEEVEGPEFTLAATLLRPLAEAAPDLVPEPLRRFLRQGSAQAVRSGTAETHGVRTGRAALAKIATYRKTGDLTVLLEAVALFRAAATSTDAGDGDGLAWSNLGAALQMVADRTGRADGLDEAVDACRRAVAVTPDDDPALAERFAVLGSALAARGEQDPSTGLFDEAVATLRRALALATSDEALASYESALAGVHQAFYDRTGEVDHLHEAVKMTRRSVARDRAGDTAGQVWTNHCAALSALYVRTADADVLTEAIAAARRALRFFPRDQHARALPLGNLAHCLLSLFERTGEETLLHEAEERIREAIDLERPEGPTRTALLSGLCLILRSSYERCGDPAKLGEAIAAGRSAVGDGDGDGVSVRRAAVLANLSLALHMSSAITGDSAELEEAAVRAGHAVSVTPAGHPDLVGRLANLAIVLRSLAERTGDLSLLDEGISACRTALASAAEGDPHRHAAMSSLALSLRAAGARRHDTDLLAEAVATNSAVVAATARSDPDRPGRLSNHMIILRAAYTLAEDPVLLDEAVAAGYEARALLPLGHGRRPAVLANLGLALSSLGALRDGERFRREAREVYGQAARCVEASTLLRVWAYREEALLASRQGDHGAAMKALEGAVVLLPRIAGRALDRRDREHELGRTSGIAAQIAPVAVAAGQPERAVELLEQARGLLLSEAIQERSADVERLVQAAPALAERFEELRREFLAEPGGPAVDELDQGYEASARARVADGRRRAGLDARWTALLAEIRAVSGLETFLRPTPIAELRAQLTDGPLVYVYAGEIGCGAIVVHGTRPLRTVSCPDVTGAEVFARAAGFRKAMTAASSAPGYAERLAGQQEMNTTLEWLWNVFAQPALEAAQAGGGPVKRLWWCPVGILAHLPLHAAGHHRERAGRTVLDRTISSYTPSLRALSYARRPLVSAAPPGAHRPGLIVSVPTPPGVTPLPGVVWESSVLSGMLPDATLLTGADAVRERVLEALPGRWIVHFACHALSDWVDPSAGRILLTDHREAPLTLRHLMRSVSSGGALCYLSACATADSAPRFSDEALHLTSVFQLIGFRQVIGTLWPVNDANAVQVSTSFYRALLDASEHSPPELTAEALRSATRMMRDVMPGAPLHWAGYVHSGA